MYDIRPVRHVRACACGRKVVVTGTIGPCNICDICAERLLAVIWGERWPDMKAHLENHGKFSYPGADLPVQQGRQRRRRAARPPAPAR